VFVPCAGPVLAAITVVSANHRYDFSSIVLTVAFALGIAVPLLVFAVLGQQLAERMQVVRSRAAVVRKVVGAVLVLTALVIASNLTDGLQRHSRDTPTPSRATSRQYQRQTGPRAGHRKRGVGSTGHVQRRQPTLQECGAAPPISGISRWLNTPGGRR